MRIRRLGRLAYAPAWALQRDLHARIVAGSEPDTTLLVEHDSVYTAGRRTRPDERPANPAIPVIDVDRGGKITWHGPGQLVGYPLVHLADPVDVVAYVRRLESLLMDVCEALGLPTRQVQGRSGVWTSDGKRKIGAIGVRVASGVTMHGFAVNADPDLHAYDSIIACGLRDAGVSSLTRELGRPVGVPALTSLVEVRLPSLVGVAA